MPISLQRIQISGSFRPNPGMTQNSPVSFRLSEYPQAHYKHLPEMFQTYTYEPADA